ncbi:MAG: serine hydrolase domain-containing protein [Bryobacteraceae bacterium]
MNRRLFLATLLPSLLAAQGLPGISAEQLARVETVVTSEMSRLNIPGLSVAIVTGGELRWANGYGLADLENSVPAKAATVYRLASISKPITAVAAMQLVERGKLDLDAPVRKYLPSFPEKEWPITARQLLGHLGGVRHYRSGEEVNSTRHYESVCEALDIFQNDALMHQPGTKYAYTTYGYNLLGCVVELASATRFADYIRKNIFLPAGMETIRPDNVFDIVPNRAQGYRRTSGGELRNSNLADTSNKIPGGGLCSTVVDLARFAIAMQSDVLLKKETRERMFTRQKLADGTETAYGLGWSVAEHDGRRVVSHGGAQQRVSTILYTAPDLGFAAALMCNMEGANLGRAAREMARIFLESN